MGVINITQRSERLGNLGSTGMAHGVSNVDIGTVQHHRAGIYAPHMARPGMRMGDAIGGGIRALGAVAGAIGAVMQREEDRKVDDYANAMLDNMEKMGRDDRDVDDWNAPDRKHLQGQKKGFYLRTGEGTKTVVDEWETAFADTFKKIGDSIDANDRVRQRTMDKLRNYRRATVSRLADHRAGEYRRMELDSAKGNLATQKMLWKDGRPEVLPDIFEQQERVDTLSRATPEMRKANRTALAFQLASDFVDNSIQGCSSEADFDEVEEALQSGMKDKLPDQIAENLPDGQVDGDFQKSLMDKLNSRRASFKAAVKQGIRDARARVARDASAAEVELFGKTDGDLAAYYKGLEAIANNEELRSLYPERAASLLRRSRAGMERLAGGERSRTANADREKAAALKEDLEKQGQWLLVPPDEADADGIEAWNQSRVAYAEKVEAAFVTGHIDADEFKKLRAGLSKTYDAAHVRAINFFDRGFGLDRTKGLADADAVGRWLEKGNDVKLAGGDEIDAKDMARWRNRYLYELESLIKDRPTANVDEFARKAFDTVMAEYAEENTPAIIERFAEARYEATRKDVEQHNAARSVARRLYPSRTQRKADEDAAAKQEKDDTSK